MEHILVNAYRTSVRKTYHSMNSDSVYPYRTYDKQTNIHPYRRKTRPVERVQFPFPASRKSFTGIRTPTWTDRLPHECQTRINDYISNASDQLVNYYTARKDFPGEPVVGYCINREEFIRDISGMFMQCGFLEPERSSHSIFSNVICYIILHAMMRVDLLDSVQPKVNDNDETRGYFEIKLSRKGQKTGRRIHYMLVL